MELAEIAEGLFKKLEKADQFFSKYRIYPQEESKRVLKEIQRLEEKIPICDSPQTEEQVLEAELKRSLQGEAANIEQQLSGRNYDFATVLKILSIPDEDIKKLRPWLEANRAGTLEAIDRLFVKGDISTHQLDAPLDIPLIKKQAEGFAEAHIDAYHRKLGKLVERLTSAGTLLRDVRVVATSMGRSYFNQITKTLAIGIPAICFQTDDGTLQLREHELIRIYGHEGMGHALHTIITLGGKLPYFLRRNSFASITTMESVAQHYQRVIFEDLALSPETQKDLGIAHKFTEIYQDAKDSARIEEYAMRFFQYAVSVLADKSLGKPDDPVVMRKKVEILGEVAHDPGLPVRLVESTRLKFDSEGNLSPDLVRELVYCSQPVQRALEIFASRGKPYDQVGRSEIDLVLLNGFWTPVGYVQNAKVQAAKS